MKIRIGDLLFQNGIISKQQLDQALDVQKKKKKKLGEILIDLGYLSSENLMWTLSEQADIPFVELKPEMLDSHLINTFPEKTLHKDCIIPLYETEDKIYIAVGDPADDTVLKDIKKFTTKEIVTSGAEPGLIHRLLDKFFLVQQTEDTLVSEDSGQMTIRIRVDQAQIEFNDESGKTKTNVGALDLTLKISKNTRS